MAIRFDHLQFHVLRHGALGALGMALIGFALVFDVLVLGPLESERDALVERNALAAIALPTALETPGQDGRVARRVAERADDTLRRMFVAAGKAGLTLDEGNYQLSRSQEDGQVRYQLTLPVQGAYTDIRDFTGQMLNDDPALALSSVLMTRGAIAEGEIEATLQFVLYLRGER
jgi:hypothetical protein